MRWFRPAICILIIFVSPLVLIQGMANSRTILVSAGLNGFWQADISRAFLQVQDSEAGLNLSVPPQGLDLARDAYATEPLASDALFLFAVDFRSKGDTAAFERVMNAGIAIDKRSRYLGALELETLAGSGDLEGTFAVIDRLSMVHPRLISEFVQVFAAAMQDDDSIPLIRDALNSEPRWAEGFWRGLPLRQAGVLRVYDLRIQTDSGTTTETDSRLLSALASAGHFTEALEFWTSLYPDQSSDTAFLATSQFEPIGWRTISQGDRAFTVSTGSNFSVYAEGGKAGELARQLVRLSPGRYSFSANVTPTAASENLRVSLICAGQSEDGIPMQFLSDGPNWTVESSCAVHWLILSVETWDLRVPLEATVSEMDFSASS